MASYTTNYNSIFDWITNNRIPNGEHTLSSINNVNLGTVEVLNFYGNTTITTGTSQTSINSTYFPDVTGTQDTIMCIRIFHGDLTIQSGITFTPPHRTKGMFVLVKGNLTNSGTISMTAKGANTAGQNVYMWGSQFVPELGATGANAVAATSNNSSAFAIGGTGTAGSTRGTGGGGSGGAASFNSGTSTATSGAGARGTSYSGGSGGGGISISQATSRSAFSGGANGGAGGDGRVSSTTTAVTRSAGGGAGNNGGLGYKIINAISANGTLEPLYDGQVGTGGLLMLAVLNTFTNNGTIASNGSKGGNANNATGASGAGSGGGSVNVVYRTSSATGTIQALGGAAGDCATAASIGGAGGAGSTATFTIAQDGVTLPRRSLLKNGSTLYYYNFTTGTWATASGSGTAPFETYGMFDGEILALDRATIQGLYGSNNMSAVTIQTYVPS